MQLIRADEILCLLRDLPVLVRGQKLRRNRRIKNVQQHLPQRGRAAPGLILHDVAHQRFGNRAVDRVHGHMVAVIRRPAERKLRKITRADDQSAGLVRDVHQDLRALPRLTVFIGDVVHGFVMADIREMLPDGGCDIDLLHADAKLLAELDRVGLRPLRRAEARHGDALDLLPAASGQIERAHAHQQRQRAVQSAGNAEHDRFRVRVLHPLFQALRLDAQNRLRAGAQLLVIRRDERIGRNAPRQNRLAQRLIENDRLKAGNGIIACRAVPFVHEPLHVDLGDRQRSVCKRLVFCQDRPVFRDQMVPREDHVLRRFRRRRAAVDIAAGQPRRRRADQRPAVLCLADHLVGGGEIQNDGRAARAEPRRRRAGNPQILAELHAEGVVLHPGAAEQKLRSKRHALAAERERIRPSLQRFRGGKLPQLIEFAVIRQMRLRHHAEQPSCVDDCRAVIEFSAEAKRKPDRRDRVEVLRRLHDPRQRRLDRAEQAVGEKQIAARVACQAKLRQRQQIHARRVRLTHPRQNLLRIILHIRDHDVDRPGSGLDKTVFHGTVLLIL